MTLRTRLTAAFVVVVLVPLLVGGLLVTRAFPRANATRQGETATASARLVATVLAGYCDRARATAEAAGRAWSGAPGPAGARAVADLVQRGLADGVRVSSPSGATVAAAGTAPTTAAAGDCVTGVPGTEPFLTAAVQLNAASGADAGRALASYRVDTALARRLQAAVGTGQVALLVGSRVVASSGRLPADLVPGLVESPEQVSRASAQVAVLSPAREGQPYTVVVALPQARGPGLLALTVAVLLGAVLLAAGIAWLLARATTRPLEALGEAAARIASGDLDTAIEVRSRDEVGRLAETFNDMTEDLRTYVRALEASRDELQAGLSRLGDTLSSTHDLARILTVVLETAMASTRAQAGMVLMFGAARSELVLEVARGVEERGVPADLRLPAGQGVTGRVAQTGEIAMGRLGDGAGQLRPAPGEPARGSVIAVPLKSSGTVIGVLDLFDRLDAETFDQRDLATIRTFASQATVAIDNVLLHDEARRLSITDGLTGLWNYRYFTMTIGKEIERSARFGRPLALLMLDLDLFKAVNDTYGHQRGDAVLVELAARVRSQVRDVDTVARYGGEEVVVILPETDEPGAAQAAERICDAVRRRPFGEPGQHGIEVTVSIGAAVFPAHGGSSSTLLRRADEALYEAKDAGRDTWRLATAAPAETAPH
ncbi:MAG: diguanylate cyclase [Frankiaceae bacterium]|nr:diguanylate cyclase [Frankiaceae bacterium]